MYLVIMDKELFTNTLFLGGNLAIFYIVVVIEVNTLWAEKSTFVLDMFVGAVNFLDRFWMLELT